MWLDHRNDTRIFKQNQLRIKTRVRNAECQYGGTRTRMIPKRSHNRLSIQGTQQEMRIIDSDNKLRSSTNTQSKGSRFSEVMQHLHLKEIHWKLWVFSTFRERQARPVKANIPYNFICDLQSNSIDHLKSVFYGTTTNRYSRKTEVGNIRTRDEEFFCERTAVEGSNFLLQDYDKYPENTKIKCIFET